MSKQTFNSNLSPLNLDVDMFWGLAALDADEGVVLLLGTLVHSSILQFICSNSRSMNRESTAWKKIYNQVLLDANDVPVASFNRQIVIEIQYNYPQ
jgi:hypothetical protein